MSFYVTRVGPFYFVVFVFSRPLTETNESFLTGGARVLVQSAGDLAKRLAAQLFRLHARTNSFTLQLILSMHASTLAHSEKPFCASHV